tara:strand:+ start:936 stop:1733 length:798 start_codon:yes stop_codon:yes gene_type:complete
MQVLFVFDVNAAGAEQKRVIQQEWSFSGIFGTYDNAQLQRGFQVYKEVCSSCHSMSYVYYRNLAEEGGPGFSPEEAKAIAAEYTVIDGPDEYGEMFERPAKPSDAFVSPYQNVNEARASNGGAYPPDFSVLAKARSTLRGFPWWFVDLFTGYQEQGVDYIYALLNGYTEAPEGYDLQPGMYYNEYYPGNQIAMVSPLSDEIVEYADGTTASVDQMAKDVSAFMMWAAEPKLEQRKKMGFKVSIFLIILAGLLYYSKKKIWSRIDH